VHGVKPCALSRNLPYDVKHVFIRFLSVGDKYDFGSLGILKKSAGISQRGCHVGRACVGRLLTVPVSLVNSVDICRQGNDVFGVETEGNYAYLKAVVADLVQSGSQKLVSFYKRLFLRIRNIHDKQNFVLVVGKLVIKPNPRKHGNGKNHYAHMQHH